MEEKEGWKNRPIRMPDSLWYKVMIEAGTRKMDLAEFVRQAIINELGGKCSKEKI